MSRIKENLICGLTDYNVIGAYISYGEDIINFYIVPEVGKDLRPALQVQIKELVKEYVVARKHKERVRLSVIPTNSTSRLRKLMPRGYEILLEQKKQVIAS